MNIEQFNALSRAEQRVAVAKDVIAQIKAKRYKPGTGHYVYLDDEQTNLCNQPVKENFSKIKNCQVCAIGSTILSIAKYKNTIEFRDVATYAESWSLSADKLLRSIFPKVQLALMEASFEGGNNNYTKVLYNYELPDHPYNKCDTFYSKYPDVSKRLVAIMSNIISNAGTFKP